MQPEYECPACSSDTIVPTSLMVEGERVMLCMTCDARFLATHGELLSEEDYPMPGDDDGRGFSGNPDLPEVQGYV